MTEHSQDQGVIQVLLDRFNQQRLPRALEMKARLDAGQTLDEGDIRYLESLLDDIQNIRPLIERHPEYETLVLKGMALYKEITDKALANAKS